jgi:hypothetical protein
VILAGAVLNSAVRVGVIRNLEHQRRATPDQNVSGAIYGSLVSLTSAIADKDHPLSRWLGASLGRTSAVRASYAAALPVRRVQRPVAAGRTVVRWDLLGIAVDFRLRCAFVDPEVPPSAAAGVMTAGVHGSPTAQKVGESLVDAYLLHLRAYGPHRRGRPWLLGGEAEARLNRMCFALAWFDRIYREGVIPRDSPLASLVTDDLDALLDCVPEYAVMDLQVQVRLADRALGDLRDSTELGACRAAPTFVGSGDVGGADADLVVGGLLVEIKSVSRPETLPNNAIWQLAGYALLDYDDEHRFDEVSFYLSRIGWLVTWQADEYFRLLGARAPLGRLRAEVARELSSFVSPSNGWSVDGQRVCHDQGPNVNRDGEDRQKRTEAK